MLFAGSRREDFEEAAGGSLLSAVFHRKGDNRVSKKIWMRVRKVNKGARMLNNVQQEKL